WLPRASGTIPAATAAAEPLEEPPGVWAGLCGLRVLPGSRVANSVVTVFPMITAPAARSMATTAASREGVRPAWSTEPFSVGMSAVSMMSFTPTGTPWSGPIGRPARRRSSAARAWAIAWSGSRNAHAWTSGSTSRARARQASTSWAEPMTPALIRRAASAAESAWRLVRSTDRVYREGAGGAGPSFAVEELREPEGHARPDVHEDEADADDDHVRHHPREDLVQRHVLGRHALEVEGRHRHRRRQEGGLEVDRHHGAEEDRVDLEVAEQGDEDRAEDDDDLGPLQRPAEQEDDELGDELEAHRRQVHAQHPSLDHRLAAVEREDRREQRRADEEPADHGRRLGGQEGRL